MNHPERNAGIGQGIGEQHRLRVGHGKTQQQPAKHCRGDRVHSWSERKQAKQEERCRCEFDKRITQRDSDTAIAASSLQQNPAQDRYVVPTANLREAMRAAGAGHDDGFVLRQAADADVQEAAESQSGKHCKDGEKHSHAFRQYRGRIGYSEFMTTPATTSSDEATAAAGRVFAQAVAIMARLRAPGGCPWDREQSFDSIRKYTLEETYEVLDAIERRNWQDLKEELGDLLLQVLFYAQMAAEPGYFSIVEVIEGLNRKLVRRHPHVFGEAASIEAGNAASAGMETDGIDANQVLRNWEVIKRAERAADTSEFASVLDSVPRTFPALMEAAKIGGKAAKSGFDWPDVEGVLEKLQEEISELRAEIAKPTLNVGLLSDLKQEESGIDRVAAELGDVLFTVVNLARHLGVDPELALRQTNRKFRDRFAAMERSAQLPLQQLGAEELEDLWSQAKRGEATVAESQKSAGDGR